MIKLPEYLRPVAEYKPEAQLILGKPCYVQEKLDGSQFSFAYLEGNFYARSRNLQIFPDQVPDLFTKAYFGAKALCEAGALPSGFIYRAEAFKGPKHNTLKYSREPRHGFVVYDVQHALTMEWVLPGDFEAMMRTADCEHAAKLEAWSGLMLRDQLIAYLKENHERQSMLGGALEGFVFKEWSTSPDRAVVKIVREQFKELHAGNPDWERVGPTKGLNRIDKVLSALAGPARYAKALSHVKEQGLYTGSMRDMPHLMRELNADMDSDNEEIQALLWEVFGKEIKRQLSGGLALWYKDQLRKESPDGV